MSTDKREPILFFDGWRSVTVTPTPEATEDQIQHDVDAGMNLAERMLDRGTTEANGTFRKHGPLRTYVGKQVGPPIWRLPRVIVKVSLRKRCVWVGAGWRFTLHQALVIWKGRTDAPPASGTPETKG